MINNMSDGNFNTALLPHTPYASGLRMGRAQMRMTAREALRTIAATRFPHLSKEELEGIISDFDRLLR